MFLCLVPTSEGGGRGITSDLVLSGVLGGAEGAGQERDRALQGDLRGSFPSSSSGGGDSAAAVLRGLSETWLTGEGKGSFGETGWEATVAVSLGRVGVPEGLTLHCCAGFSP